MAGPEVVKITRRADHMGTATAAIAPLPLRATKSCDDGALRLSVRRRNRRRGKSAKGSAAANAASGRRRRSASLQDLGARAAEASEIEES